MSTSPLIRYPLDPTGLNPDNFINGEIKTLSLSLLRAVAPMYSPFYTESFTAYDNGNGRPLTRGVDYQIVDMLQSATLKFGKEIAQVVLIINSDVSNEIRINYQTLGGLFQNNSEGLANLYDAVMGDNRPIDWSRVLNKPTEYTPTLHNHLLEDIYGFESVIVALERIRNAIVLSDVPAFEALVDWVKANSSNAVIVDETVSVMNKDTEQVFHINTCNNRNGSQYFWKVVHKGTTTDLNFDLFTGSINIFQNKGQFALKTSLRLARGNQPFDVVITRDSLNGPVATTIEGIIWHGASLDLTIADMVRTCCSLEPGVKMDATSLFMLGDK